MSCKIRVFNLTYLWWIQYNTKAKKMLNGLSNDIYCLCKTESFDQQAANFLCELKITIIPTNRHKTI